MLLLHYHIGTPCWLGQMLRHSRLGFRLAGSGSALRVEWGRGTTFDILGIMIEPTEAVQGAQQGRLSACVNLSVHAAEITERSDAPKAILGVPQRRSNVTFQAFKFHWQPVVEPSWGNPTQTVGGTTCRHLMKTVTRPETNTQLRAAE